MGWKRNGKTEEYHPGNKGFSSFVKHLLLVPIIGAGAMPAISIESNFFSPTALYSLQAVLTFDINDIHKSSVFGSYRESLIDAYWVF